MKTKIFFSILFIMLFFQGFSQQTSVKIELNNNWKFHKVGTNLWYDATVPGCVHTDLLTNELIPDPFFGENEADLQWIDKFSWEYKTKFSIDESVYRKQHIELDFKGLDTYAEVFLNGKQILTTDNMFSEWQTDIKPLLNTGENTLRVLFHSPVVMGLLSRDKFNLEAPFGYNFEFLPSEWPNWAPYVRKAAYMNGWDWGPKLTTSGIWRPVFLKAWDNVKIKTLDIVQNEHTEKKAEVTAIIKVKSSVSAEAKINVSFQLKNKEVKTVSLPIQLHKGENTFETEILIDNPQLWWPNGLGEQPLYTCTCKLIMNNEVVTTSKTKIGLRTVKLVQEPQADGGKSFYFEVNGSPVFAKGANYIPSDIFPSRVTYDHYEEIIKAAADAHMNMLRVWGGGIYESDIFYDLCDKYGIMIWQDFAFAIYHTPDYPEFLASIQKELKDNITRLRNHPSIVLWCGNNETEMVWEMLMKKFFGYKIDANNNLLEELIPFPVSENVDPEVTARVEKAYDHIYYKLIPEAIEKYDYNSHNYWPSSPMGGWKKPVTAAKPQSGDLHFYIAMLNLPFSAYQETPSRFFSEHGFHAWPDKKAVYEFTNPEDRQIDSPVMNAHNKELSGNALISKYILMYYREPKNFDSYIYLSQAVQAEGMKLALETHRSWMPYTMGTLYWQINDVWPGATWASMDYKNRLKPLHYKVKKAFAPISVIASDFKNEFKVNVVADQMKSFKAKIEMKITDFDGKVLWNKSVPVEVQPNNSVVCFKTETSQLLENINIKDAVFTVKLKKGKKILSSNYLYFTEPKNLELKQPEIKKEIVKTESGYSVTLSANTLVKNLYLDFDGEGKFSDNFFDLFPGESSTVHFIPNDETDNFSNRLKLFSLIDTY